MRNALNLPRFFSVMLFSGLFIIGGPNQASAAQYFSILNYNVENLFDTEDDPGKRDGEFTPDGRYKWTEEKLSAKFDNLTRVLRSVNDGVGPAVVTLTEVENMNVLAQWCATDGMQELGYMPILIEGPDARGIDVALLTKFPLMTDPVSINVSDPDHGRFTRDVLLVTLDINGYPLYIFVNHWPSRLGGVHSRNYRREIAKRVYQVVTEIMTEDPEADIILAGDFNDEPEDLSVRADLKVSWDIKAVLNPRRVVLFSAVTDQLNYTQLMKEYKDRYEDYDGYDPKAYSEKLKTQRGTYYYSREKTWHALDQFIFNRNLFDKSRIRYYGKSFRVLKHPFMRDTNGFPKSTKSAGLDGMSDHFPIVARFVVDDPQ